MQIKTLLGPPWARNGALPDPSPKNRADATRPSAEAEGAAAAGDIRAACADMESLFIYHLLKEMQATVPESGLMGGGTTAKMYTDMMHQHLARDLAAGGGIGLAEILMAQLSEGGGAPPEGEGD
jgi:Rod binding domain-containing protein